MFQDFVVENTPKTRVDRYLKRLFPTFKQAQLEKWLRSKDILVNGQKVDAAFRVDEQDIIQIKTVIVNILHHQTHAPQKSTTQVPSKEEADLFLSWILYDDQEIIVINKPSGMATQGGTGTHLSVDSLLKSYAHYYSKDQKLRLVHRLDRDTSGVLVIACTLKVANHLADQFKTRTMDKVYWAICHGKPTPLHGIVDAPLIKKTRPSGDGEAVFVDFKQGKKAKTIYRVIKSFGKMCWYEFKPQTGRTHQLRVHSAYMNTPIVGDHKYGEHTKGKEAPQKLHLHARSLTLTSLDGDVMTFTAPPSSHMEETLSKSHIDWEKFA